MPRIPYPRPDQIDDEARRWLEGVPPFNVMRMLSYSAPALTGILSFGQGTIYSTQIDPVLREVAIVRVGHLSRCAYELDAHNRWIAKLGFNAEKIKALEADIRHPAFTDAERAVLAFTDDIVNNVRASDTTLSELRRHLPDRQVIELILTVGCYRMVCMLLETTGVDIETADADQPAWKEWESRIKMLKATA